MNARILIHLDVVHPVTHGRWHRVAYLRRLPHPGEVITMMCGESAPAEFVAAWPMDEPALTTCWGCDLAYRRAIGIQVLPNHPALAHP